MRVHSPILKLLWHLYKVRVGKKRKNKIWFPEIPNNYAGIKNETFEEFFAKGILY